MRSDLARRLRKTPIEVVLDDGEAELKAFHDVVVVLVMTQGSVQDQALARRFRSLFKVVPIIPVIEGEPDDYYNLEGDWTDFDALQMLRLTSPEAIEEAVQIQLGLKAHRHHRRLFLSYNADDGEAYANRVQGWLEAGGFQVYRDRTDLVGGEPWYTALMRAIRETDFLLLLSTPGLVGSEFVQREVAAAQANHAPVRVLQIGKDGWIPHSVKSNARLETQARDWNWMLGDRSLDTRVRSFVNAGLGRRDVFDRRIDRMLRHLSGDMTFEYERVEGERSGLVDADQRRIQLVWNAAIPSFQLMYNADQVRQRVDEAAGSPLLICTEEHTTTLQEREAAAWAAAKHEMRFCSISQLEEQLRTLLEQA
ncbi:MAG: toll/interleukin-1 receptor domain-containing protein [Myxococcota bacterium]